MGINNDPPIIKGLVDSRHFYVSPKEIIDY